MGLKVFNDYMRDHGCIPYCVVLQLLAMRHLRAGLVDADDKDHDHPYRSSKALSCMCWNLGNWQRARFAKEPLPETLKSLEDMSYQILLQNIDLLETSLFTTTSLPSQSET